MNQKIKQMDVHLAFAGTASLYVCEIAFPYDLRLGGRIIESGCAFCLPQLH